MDACVALAVVLEPERPSWMKTPSLWNSTKIPRKKKQAVIFSPNLRF